ncbi:MAG: prepilin-type N-terminal cleavage/methylation domain-containing protein [Candidatus Saccharimonadales bacterium]
MKRLIAKKQRGFTIVELLIVIIVIAILAAIIIVAYTGVQKRAYDAKRGLAISEYIKLLKMYKVHNGDYPDVELSCLGKKDDYPATSRWVNGRGACVGMDNGTLVYPIYRVDDALANSFSSLTKSVPKAEYPEFVRQGQVFRGPLYRYMSQNFVEINFTTRSGDTNLCAQLGDGTSYHSEVQGDTVFCQIYLR